LPNPCCSQATADWGTEPERVSRKPALHDKDIVSIYYSNRNCPEPDLHPQRNTTAAPKENTAKCSGSQQLWPIACCSRTVSVSLVLPKHLLLQGSLALPCCFVPPPHLPASAAFPSVSNPAPKPGPTYTFGHGPQPGAAAQVGRSSPQHHQAALCFLHRCCLSPAQLLLSSLLPRLKNVCWPCPACLNLNVHRQLCRRTWLLLSGGSRRRRPPQTQRATATSSSFGPVTRATPQMHSRASQVRWGAAVLQPTRPADSPVSPLSKACMRACQTAGAATTSRAATF
jgi:hypothetical protein